MYEEITSSHCRSDEHSLIPKQSETIYLTPVFSLRNLLGILGIFYSLVPILWLVFFWELRIVLGQIH